MGNEVWMCVLIIARKLNWLYVRTCVLACICACYTMIIGLDSIEIHFYSPKFIVS